MDATWLVADEIGEATLDSSVIGVEGDGLDVVVVRV